MSVAWALCREVRRRSGLSQRQLAASAGVSPSTVARIERQRMEPTLDLLTRLVEAGGLELRMRLEALDPADTPRSPTSFEARLDELLDLSTFVAEARRHAR